MGAGAIGQWLAALLSFQAGKVTLLCRERQLAGLQEGGIRYIPPSATGDSKVVRCYHELASELTSLRGQRFGSVIATVKAFQVAELVEQFRVSGIEFDSFCTLQNGWSSDSLVLKAFPHSNVWVTTTTIAVAVEDGVILPATGKGGVAAAQAAGPSSAPPLWLTQLGLPFIVLEDWRSLKWSKMLLNMVCNASCALLDWYPGQVVAHSGLFSFELQCLREALKVARRLGIPLVDAPGYPVRRFAHACQLYPWLARRVLAPRIAKGRGSKAPSFLVDMRAGRGRTEVSYINGAIAREARLHGIEAPCNENLARLMEEVSAKPELWERYRGKPERLLKDLTPGF